MGRLDRKVAIVTGAADGPKAALGAAFAKALAAEGRR
jgi:NAD(P)-dependent dehydrogenase (short-subunit alcohol dehydrogenase family)